MNLLKSANNNFILMAMMVVAIVMIMILPLTSFALDLTIGFNIVFSLMILLISMSVKEVLEFSIFPTVLLLVTLYRLSLNISSTQSILSDAKAGTLIETFGSFVLGGNAPVGFIIFLIIVLVNFLVITKGAERVSEVAARFTLDALPGKQMSIDAALNSGMISEEEAKLQKSRLQKESDFYSAMDGASKFVKGDAVAGLIITAINIIAGMIFGVLDGLSIQESLSTYTILTVGDGLVSQIPALLISVATGVVVTRPFNDEGLGEEFFGQIFTNKSVLYIAAIVSLSLNILPGTNKIAFTIVAFILFFLAYNAKAIESDEDVEVPDTSEEEEYEKDYSEYYSQEVLEIEFGVGLVHLFRREKGGDFAERVEVIRRTILKQYGFMIPSVRLRDNINLEPYQYIIKVNGAKVSSYVLRPDDFLAIPSGEEIDIPGERTIEPSYSFPAVWITENDIELAKSKDYSVTDSVSVLATNFTEVVKERLHELVTRESIKELIDYVERDNPTIVDELIPDKVGLGEIQKIVVYLLRELVPIKNFNLILEAIADNIDKVQGIESDIMLSEFVRQKIKKQFIPSFVVDETLECAVLDSKAEDLLMDNFNSSQFGKTISLSSNDSGHMISEVQKNAQKMLIKGRDAVIVCSPILRFYLKRYLDNHLPFINVVSYDEVNIQEIDVNSIGVISHES